ncbi:hypothetical protein CRUP_002095, partial [Coryphaenoides rupestris]
MRCAKEAEPCKRPIVREEPKNASQVSAAPLKMASADAHTKTSGGGDTLQVSMPKAPVQSTEPGPMCPSQAKGGPKPAGPAPDSGVQIRVFPAARDTAGHGATVQTCQKEMALNEVQVMNQLSHGNVLQLYQAMESHTQVVLLLEYVEGGELFERIVDESTPLTEVDAMVFVKHICQGLHYIHQMYPENILCVDRTSHQVKIIDFGLARRYKPGGKLRVNFGTPEFLAPEVVNFDFVSFPTDMWTLGVVTYMLVSGMSPFLGDEDNQTMSNVLAATWYFDEDAFEHVSAEARDFISNLLIREK